jgi:hypothetical protein
MARSEKEKIVVVRSAFSKAMRVGRAGALLVGLVVMLAVVLGAGTTALAGTGVGATFNLGKANSVNALSSLVGSTTGSMLKVDNNGSGAALDLQVGPSATPPEQKAAAPMKVDSQAKVANLNADEIDGKDSSEFLAASTYTSESPLTSGVNVGNGSGIHHASWQCDQGDELLTGGYRWAVNSTSLAVVGSWPSNNTWLVQWANTSDANQPYEMWVYVKCADTAAPAHD